MARRQIGQESFISSQERRAASSLSELSALLDWSEIDHALARLEAHNADVRRIRCRIEKVFGTCKRSYGLRRMHWLGLAKAGLQVRLTAIAYNLRRSWRLLAATPG